MKKIAFILTFMMAFATTLNAQQKKEHKKPKFSPEQHVNLALKKMTLSLDLSEKQQDQIKPLLIAKAASKKAAMEKRKKAKESKKRPTADEIYAIKMKRLDAMILMKSKMKNILNKEQFEKFEKHMHRKHAMAKRKMKKGGKKKKMMHHKKEANKL